MKEMKLPKLYTVDCEEFNSDCYWPLPVPFHCVFTEDQLEEAEELVRQLNAQARLESHPTWDHYEVVPLYYGLPRTGKKRKILSTDPFLRITIDWGWCNTLSYYVNTDNVSVTPCLTKRYGTLEIMFTVPYREQTKEDLIREIDEILMKNLDLLIELTKKKV